MVHDHQVVFPSKKDRTEQPSADHLHRPYSAVTLDPPSVSSPKASTSQVGETSWNSLSTALQLDLKTGSAALVEAIKRHGSAVLSDAENHATQQNWQRIRERSREAWRRYHAERQSTRNTMPISDTTILLQLLLVMSHVHVNETARASRLLYRLISDISFHSLMRLVLPLLAPILEGLTRRESPLDVLSSLSPMFAKRRGSGWELPVKLQHAIWNLSTSIADPIEWLHRELGKIQTISQPIRLQILQSGIAEMSLFFTLRHRSSRTLRNLLDEVKRLGLPVSTSALASLSYDLASKENREHAMEICALIDIDAKHDNFTRKKIVRMLHKLGKDLEAATLITSTSLHIDFDLLLDIVDRSVEGDRQDLAIEMIKSRFPRLTNILTAAPLPNGLTQPERQVLKRLYLALVKARDIEQAGNLLRLLLANNFSLRSSDFNVLLKAYSEQNNVKASHSTLQLMKQYKIYPDLFTYSTLMTVYANRKNFSAVQSTFDEMVRHGITPDAIAYAILLNAYIEEGDWLKASRFWQQLPVDVQADRSIANTLLKGMMLLSAPFPEIYRVFLSASSINPPDQHAWTILIQSACDGAHLSRARELYHDFKLLTSQDGSKLQVDHFLASILVVGHIRHGKVSMAKRLYEEMRQEGVLDTSVTYAAIIDAALKGSWPMSTARAKALAHQLLAESEALQRERHKGRGQPIENVVQPLMRSAIRDGEIEEVERLFALSLEKGNQPTTLLYSTLMDAYRRASEPDRVQQVWDAMWELEQESETAPLSGSNRRLCIPLSIYIDAMSTANRHQNILQVWAKMHQNGFGFDAQNWNHLVVALIRNGDVVRAFDIAENVLLKAQEETSSREFASIRPDMASQDISLIGTSLVGNETGLQEHLSLDPLQRPPNRRHEFRDDSAGYHALRVNRISTGGPSEAAGGLDFDPNVFEKWRPTDVTWRPTFFTTAVLERAYWDLEQGRSRSMSVLVADEDERDIDANADGEITQPAQQSSPFALLTRIRQKYAKTVSLILLHRRKRDDAMLMRRKAQGDL
ncbi:hypothetical protein NliqN6_1937 [Naganishia liquefaciens]|uniref:Pentacotripeptide-repeat region of PRORP domain-containing protein n=1 Tax=Naganishia liquefaciens TaxID=104408 RepID=A0A8H3TQV0_9TREE|nr:hypothetical protein NliqN6_1937 [Naganishia liquefaciens]